MDRFHRPELGRGGLLSSDSFLNFLHGTIGRTTFSELRMPFKVVATDFWKREEVVLESGELMTTVQASMAIPGVFTPTRIGDRVLLDGGLVNPLPYDIIQESCDLVVAVDVLGRFSGSKGEVPSFFDTIFHTFTIMQESIISQKLRCNQPGLLVKPDITNIRTLEFFRADEIYHQAAPAVAELKNKLAALIGG